MPPGTSTMKYIERLAVTVSVPFPIRWYIIFFRQSYLSFLLRWFFSDSTELQEPFSKSLSQRFAWRLFDHHRPSVSSRSVISRYPRHVVGSVRSPISFFLYFIFFYFFFLQRKSTREKTWKFADETRSCRRSNRENENQNAYVVNFLSSTERGNYS